MIHECLIVNDILNNLASNLLLDIDVWFLQSDAVLFHEEAAGQLLFLYFDYSVYICKICMM